MQPRSRVPFRATGGFLVAGLDRVLESSPSSRPKGPESRNARRLRHVVRSPSSPRRGAQEGLAMPDAAVGRDAHGRPAMCVNLSGRTRAIGRIAKARLRILERPDQVRLAPCRVRTIGGALPRPSNAARGCRRTPRTCRDREFPAIERRGKDLWSVSGILPRPRNAIIAEAAWQDRQFAILPNRQSYWTTSTSMPSLSRK